MDTSDAWITTRTGIRQRRYCTDNEDAATLAIAAARQAMARSGLDRQRILPAALWQPSPPQLPRQHGMPCAGGAAPAEDRPAFDVNAACTGFLYAAAGTHGLLATLGGQYALVIGCEAPPA